MMITSPALAELRQRRSAARQGMFPATEPHSAHLVGVCGSGMKALAELLSGMGWQLTGSDLQPSAAMLDSLARKGLRIHSGHGGHLLPADVEMLIYSPAVGVSNPERRLASRLNIPQFSYSQMLGRLMRSRVGVCIAGTHGKSTTTAMAASILSDAGLSPSAVVGAELQDRHVNGWAGAGDILVAESCEYQRSFLDLHPTHAAVLGIEPDHFDCYADLDELEAAFAEFCGLIPAMGTLLIRGDCEVSRRAAAGCEAPVMTFSDTPGADWWAADVRPTREGVRFRTFLRGDYFTEISMPLRGRHNVLNALAAIGLAQACGVEAGDIRESLAEFRGIRRRFEPVGSWRGMTLIDDYAHHPTAIRAGLAAAREEFGRRRVWCVFQPHQVSRTAALLDEFAASFTQADRVLIAPVYAAREDVGDEAETVSQELADRISSSGGRAGYCGSLDRILATLDDEALPGDVLITMGAGDINQVHHEFTRRLQRDHAPR